MLTLGGSVVLVSGCSDSYVNFLNKISNIIKSNKLSKVYQAIFHKVPSSQPNTLLWSYIQGTQSRNKTDFTINGKFTFTFLGQAPDQKITKKIILNIKDSSITFA